MRSRTEIVAGYPPAEGRRGRAVQDPDNVEGAAILAQA